MAKTKKFKSFVKNNMEQKKLEEAKKKSDVFKKRTRLLSLASLLIVGVLLLMMLVNFASVYNTNIGIEKRITGFNCVAAGLSGNFTDMSLYGDIAMPFNYYAASQTHTLCTVSIVVLFVIVAHIVVALFAVITNKQGVFNFLTIALGLAEGVLFIVCYAVARSMKDAEILSGFCQGNPACSIESTAILPALLAIFSLALPILAIIMTQKHKAEMQAAPAPQVKSVK